MSVDMEQEAREGLLIGNEDIGPATQMAVFKKKSDAVQEPSAEDSTSASQAELQTIWTNCRTENTGKTSQ